jgi:Ca2+-binding EF-hand superfamily protein
VLDNDCNGALSRTEAREAFDVIFQITLTDDEFDKSFNKMDKDSDGSVPYKEFKKYFKHSIKQKEKILARRNKHRDIS